KLLPRGVEKQMGIIGMKVMARGRILSSWTPPPVEQQKRSWEGRGAITTIPGTLTKQETFFYNLSLPISTAIIGCDSVEQVEECVELARSFTPLNQTGVQFSAPAQYDTRPLLRRIVLASPGSGSARLASF